MRVLIAAERAELLPETWSESYESPNRLGSSAEKVGTVD